MKNYLALLFLLFTTVAYSQGTKHKERGKINKREYFEFTNYKTSLEFLDVNRKDGIDGDSYFYFTAIDKTTRKKSVVVIRITSYFATNKIKKFSDLRNGFVTDPDYDYEIPKHTVNDSVYNKIKLLSEDQFFSKYVDDNSEFGVLQGTENWEVEKAVLLRLMKSGISVCQQEITGDWQLRKDPLFW